jgi:MoaA/NifB/PqqE/SkfB family radical SAM enzyme
MDQCLEVSKIKHLQIAMGNQCNQECSFCYQEDRSAKSVIDEVIWKERLNKVYDNLETITIIGGEPTIMKNCSELIQLIYNKYPSILLKTITNGINFNDLWCDVFLSRGDKVIFSINAATSNTYNKIIKNGNFEKSVNNMAALIEKRNKIKSPLKIHASYVVTQENKNEILNFVKLCLGLGVDKCFFIMDFVKPIIVDDEFGREVDEICKLIDTNDVKMEVDGLLALLNRDNKVDRPNIPMCSIPWHSIDITRDGFVSFCCAAWLPIGNLLTQDIETIWNSKTAIKMRNQILSGNYSMCKKDCNIDSNPANHNYFYQHYLLQRELIKIMHNPKERIEIIYKKLTKKLSK